MIAGHPDLQGKPTLLMVKLPGKHLETVSPEHCRQLGAMLGRLHTISTAYPVSIKNAFDSSWMDQALGAVRQHLSKAEIALLQTVIDRYQTLESSTLPQGLIHGDLFTDNILFKDNALVGVLDFFHIGHDLWLMDLAIAAQRLVHESAVPKPCQRTQQQCSRAIMLNARSSLKNNEHSMTFGKSRLPDSRLPRFETEAGGQFRKDPYDQLKRLAVFTTSSAAYYRPTMICCSCPG